MKLHFTACSALILGFMMCPKAEAKLKIGDDAPAIKTGEWVQGEPVTEFSRDAVYVVEFWATWCGPCVASIPHLDELHEELKDQGVVFIGQNCWERDLSKVKPFVEKMGEKMSYRVATDDTTSEERGYMAVHWMQAADRQGIPCAFVVDKGGKIAWIGHPAQLQAGLLKEVAAGTFDLQSAAAQQEKEEAAQQALSGVAQELTQAMRSEEWSKARDILERLVKENPGVGDQVAGIRFTIAMKSGDQSEVVKEARNVLAGPAGRDPGFLNQLAWGIATELKDPGSEVLEIAAEAAARGVEKTESKDAALLDTLARIQFLQGKKDAAIQTQEAAVAKADDTLRASLAKTLEAYKAGRLPADE